MNTVLDSNDFDISPFVNAGFALHWLKPLSKAPIGDGWSEKPAATLDSLLATRRAGNNVGVRLGEPSALTSGGYLHAIDLDIRIPDMADEAWEAFEALFPGITLESLPCVASGSGGDSRHLYFVSDRPFSSKMLAVSEGKHRRFRKSEGREVWSNDFEIELFGSGKHLVLPPPIHPDTGKPYTWLREFDFDAMDMGMGPYIPSSVIESLGVAETATYAFETRPPLDFKPGQMEAELDIVPVSDLHYDDWIRLGQAIHHQTGGSAEGLDLWIALTRRSSKFTGDAQVREMRRSKWKSFGKYRGQPVTMASIRQWVQDARAASFADAFDDLPDEPETPPAATVPDAFDDLLGGPAASDADDFDSIFENDDDDGASGSENLPWRSLLDLTETAAIKPTLHNLELIVCNDARLVGLPQLNEFTQETVQRTRPGTKGKVRKNAAKETRQLTGRVWDVKDTLNGVLWSDDRDFAIRSILEAPKTQGGYGLKVTDRDLKAAIVLSANGNAFHPVREYLTGLTWDGVPRCDSLFVDYLGSEDKAYSRHVARLMLVAAVARIFEPGIKFDTAVILEGLQGRGKSTFIKTLGRYWAAELEGDFSDRKAMVELMQGKWLIEVPELSGFSRADVRSIKAFISCGSDRARLAYARRAGEFPRQSIFIGSTNDQEYLRDATGGRRFLPVECHVEMIDIARLRRNVDQIWAEAVVIYRQMRVDLPMSTGDLPLYLMDHDAADEAARLQESRRVESPEDALVGQISQWLDKPIASGDISADGEGRRREVVCLVQVWREGLQREANAYAGANQQALGRAMRGVPGWKQTGAMLNFPAPYGRQRYYERIGSAGRLAELAA